MTTKKRKTKKAKSKAIPLAAGVGEKFHHKHGARK
jgi:hypothetical protein